MRHPLFAAVAFTAMLAAQAPAFAMGTDSRPLVTTDNTKAHEVVAKPVRYKGYDGLHVTVAPEHKSIEQGGCDNCTFLKLNDINFANGTIELDVAGKPSANAPKWARGFVGIVFRMNADASKYEGIYLRPKNATENDQLRRNHTVQYFSYPDHPWHKLREKTPGLYESHARIETGEWTHMRIDVDGQTAKLYVNREKEPVLVVNDMKLGTDARGTIGLFTEPATDAYFRNLVVTHR